MRKHDIAILVAFVCDQYRHEVKQSAGRVLVFVYLFIFDAHELIANIASDVQIAFQLKDVCDHFVVVGFQQIQQVISVQIKIWISID